MGWDATFRNYLDNNGIAGLRVAVVFGETFTPAYGGPGEGADIHLTNYSPPPAGGYAALGATCRVSGSSINPVDWTTEADQITVEVVGEAAVRALLAAGVHRGTLMTVYVTLPGGSPSTDAYRVWMGRLQNIVSAGQFGARTRYTLSGYGVQTLLQNRRLEVGTADGASDGLFRRDKLFVGAGDTTTLTSAWNKALDPTLSVADDGALKLETGATGMLELDDGTNVFILEFNAVASGTVTLVDGNGRFGTSSVSVASGTTVTALAYLKGHPLDILRRLLASTGTGTNGTFDDYPEAWGLGIAADLINMTNIGVWKTNVVDSTMVCEFLLRESYDNAWQWMQSWLGVLGVNVCLYEGEISVRAAQDVTDTTPQLSSFSFGTQNIAALRRWSLADERHTFERTAFDVDANPPYTDTPSLVAAKGSFLYTNPGGGVTVVDATALDNDGAAATTSTIESDIRDRRWHYHCGIAERLELEVPHRGAAQLCIGDLTRITSVLGFGIPESSSATATLNAEDVIVVQGPDLDWLANQPVQVQVLRYRDETPPA